MSTPPAASSKNKKLSPKGQLFSSEKIYLDELVKPRTDSQRTANGV